MNDIILNTEQEKAVKCESKRILLIAGAGSGKTRVLIERIAYLIEKKNVSPYEILAQTFSRKAGQEITSRLEKRLGSQAFNITTGTMHSVALNFIQRFGELIGLAPHKITVYNQFESDYLLKEVVKDLGFHTGYKWIKVRVKDVAMVMNDFYNGKIDTLVNNEDYYQELDDYVCEYGDCIDIVQAFQARCKENNALTYDSILYQFHKLLPEIKEYLGFKHIFVDECQDNAKIQWDITESMTSLCGASLYAIGDVNQCQPAGTMVLTLDGEKDIKDIVPGKDELKVYDKHDAMIFGGHNKGYQFKKSSRIFSGNLYEIHSGSKKTSCTGNHKWYVKWSDDFREIKWNVVYLMRQGNRFRVGWCQLFQNMKKEKNRFHLSIRMNIEKADSVWILKIFDNKQEASIWESIIATNYGLPTIMFEPTSSTYYYTKESIDFMFNNFWNLEAKAKKLLNDFNLDIKHPFHSEHKRRQKQGGRSIFEIETVNISILPDKSFAIPQPKETGRLLNWKNVSISTKTVKNITVYSLDVEKYHTYIADGLCTKNSIYQFRGATPEYLIDNQESFDVLKLQKNYRSDANIVEAANKLIKHNTQTIELEMVAVKEGIDNSVLTAKYMNSKAIASYLCGGGYFGDVAVLARNHFMLEKLSKLLEEAGIKHDYIGKQSKIVHDENFIRFHAFLKLIVNPNDNFAFLLVKDILGIDQENYAEYRMIAADLGLSHYNTWRDSVRVVDSNDKNNNWKEWFMSSEKGDFDTVVDWLKLVDFGFDTDQIFKFIHSWRIKNYDKDIADYLNWLTVFDVQDEIKDDSKGLQLMTIHACKGLEFETVIIAGLNETILPSKQAIKKGEIEWERNLAYVGMTRAEQQLILTSRPIKKDLFDEKNPVSRFVKEAGL